METLIRFAKHTVAVISDLRVRIEETLEYMKEGVFEYSKSITRMKHAPGRTVNFDNATDYLYMPEIESAKRHVYPHTIFVGAVVVVGMWVALFLGYFAFGISPFVVFMAFLNAFYAAHVIFKAVVTREAFRAPLLSVSDEEAKAVKKEDLPVYTILIPLYREEKVIRQIVRAMTAIDYPTNKLDVIITLESYDTPTMEAIREVGLPKHFKTLILPDVQPKTKPKALNVALTKTKGEYLVIYDAEIVPEPLQLRKAFLLFRKNPDLGALQPRLDHYNANATLITRLFNAEFSFYYDYFLPGLEKFNFPIPLSGHSTHFRADLLKRIGGWDPYNVTEDCDVGIRFARIGVRTAVFDSTSEEEATDTLQSWILQRSRWMKGFLQTSIVHLRFPIRLKRDLGGWLPFAAFILTVPGSVLFNVFNLFGWAMFGIWIVARPDFIQSLYPLPILYVSVANFFVGTFVFTYLNLYAVYKRGKYAIVKHSILSPLYWIMLALAATRGAVQLITNPYKWDKTSHGTHLAR